MLPQTAGAHSRWALYFMQTFLRILILHLKYVMQIISLVVFGQLPAQMLNTSRLMQIVILTIIA
jgi:hypothetical protein